MQDAGAAVVAAQLLAFFREPVRYRPRLTHGREPFSGGLLVFRFAQGRFPQALMRELSAARRESLREAALFFIRQVCLWEGASHYQVLCVPPGTRRETIKEHYHALMALIHPDRQEPGAPHWPAESAQRVNKAYEVLCDDARRREYDGGLHKETVGSATLEEAFMAAAETASPPGEFPKARGTLRLRMRRPVLFTSLAMSILFFASVWWAGVVPGEYSAIPNTAPFGLSLQWMREAYSGGRKLPAEGASAPGKRAPGGVDAPETSLLAPLLRVFRGGESTPPVLDAGAPVAARASVAAEPVTPRASDLTAPARRTEATASERERRQPSPPAPAVKASPPGGLAQAATNRQAAERKLTATEMESMVARVVSYYEAGDVDKLLALYDASKVGLWEAMTLRSDFEEFFRSTKSRRLRLQDVSWDTASPTARVKGAANLVAQYQDEAGTTERQVALEMDIVSRDGQPRIARLSLFPHGK